MEQFQEDVRPGDLISFIYKNWKGVTSKRKAVIQGFFFGVTKHHDEFGFFINAYDLEKLEERDFAVKDISAIQVVKNWRNF